MVKKAKAGRVRQHEICDIAQKHVELLVAESGFSPLTVVQGADYGIDLPILTFDTNGLQENGYILLQIKSAEKLKVSGSKEVTVQIKRELLRLWETEPLPVIVVRYDVSKKTGYWMYAQRWLKTLSAKRRKGKSVELTIRIPKTQKMTKAAIIKFATFKRDVMAQITGTIDHG